MIASLSLFKVLSARVVLARKYVRNHIFVLLKKTPVLFFRLSDPECCVTVNEVAEAEKVRAKV